MLFPTIVATLMTAALTLTSADGRGAQPSLTTRDLAIATPAHAADPHPEGAAAPARRINVAMEDHKFSPNVFDVRVGDTVTFVFTNFGKAVHDAFIGDKAAQEQHEKEMRATPEGHKHGHDHAHEGGIAVPPGESRTLRYSFDKAGTLEIGCHQPGHYDAEMMAVVNVNPA
jgi:uncharacterized cupredoxin-like copper-binding protein